jgi:hypothetical protein
MRSDLALQAPATDALMRAAQAWAPVNDAPMRFQAPFDLDTALAPLTVPLHAQWLIEDQLRAINGQHAHVLQLIEWANAYSSQMLRLIAFIVLVSVLSLWLARSAHKDTKNELRWAIAEREEIETLLGETAAALEDVRDALRRRQPAEALYLADRALEVA